MELPVSSTTPVSVPWQAVIVRNRYVNWMMLRDVKRRRMVKQYAVERLRITALRRNKIIPQEIQVCTELSPEEDDHLHKSLFASLILQII